MDVSDRQGSLNVVHYAVFCFEALCLISNRLHMRYVWSRNLGSLKCRIVLCYIGYMMYVCRRLDTGIFELEKWCFTQEVNTFLKHQDFRNVASHILHWRYLFFQTLRLRNDKGMFYQRNMYAFEAFWYLRCTKSCFTQEIYVLEKH